MLPSIPRLVDYDVSPYYGFLPPEAPLEILPNRYYAKWEAVGKNLQGLILSRRLRGVVDRLPILSVEYLTTGAELRRAYSLLAFISHAYIWGGDRPAEVGPLRLVMLGTDAHCKSRLSRRLFPFPFSLCVESSSSPRLRHMLASCYGTSSQFLTMKQWTTWRIFQP